MASQDGRAQLHAIVRGQVQGVGFRYFVQGRADELVLAGWVRNLPDGGVECLAEGSRDALNTLLAHLKQGPRWGKVAEVTANWGEPEGLEGFQIRG